MTGSGATTAAPVDREAAGDGEPVDVSIVLVVRQDAVLALRCLPALVAAVPATVHGDLLVLAIGMDDLAARPLAALEGAVRVVRVEAGIALGAALLAALPVGRQVVVVDGDACAPLGADDGSMLTGWVQGACQEGATAARDAAVAGFTRADLEAGADVFRYALDIPALTAIGTLLHRSQATMLSSADTGAGCGQRTVPAPAQMPLPDAASVAVVTWVPAGFVLGELSETLTRRREQTRLPYVDIIGCPPAALDALRAAFPRARVLPVGTGVVGWNAAFAAAAEFDLVAAIPRQSRLGRFWLEGLLAGQGPAVAAVLPREARWLPEVEPGERFADVAERIRRAVGATTTELAAPTGATLLMRGALLAAAPLDDRYGSVAAAWQDLAASWTAAGWRIVRADGVLVEDDGDDLPEFTGLWQSTQPDPDVTRLMRAHGLRALPDGLTATMIVKDEQAALPRALASLAGVVDDVVVADTGSGDDTVAMATALGARVVHVPWTGNFAAARNAGFASADSAWVLIIDADEEAEVADPRMLRRTLRRGSCGAFMVNVRHITGSTRRVDGALLAPSIRMFRPDTHHYRGHIHEQVTLLDGSDCPRLLADSLSLEHRGYLAETIVGKDKARRNMDTARARYELEGGWMAAYECGRAMVLAGEDADAEPFLRLAAEGMPVTHSTSTSLFRLLAYVANINNRPDTLELARRSVEIRPSDVDSVMACAALLLHHGEPLEAISTIDAYADAGTDQLWSNSTAAEIRLPTLRGEALVACGRTDEAVDALRDVARQHPGGFTGWRLLTGLLLGRDPHWAREVARLARPAPHGLLGQIRDLAVAHRGAVLDALRSEGVDVTSVLAQDRDSAGALQPGGAESGLATGVPFTVGGVDRARRAELTRPDVALDLWRALPVSVDRAAGEARCLVALHRTGEAYDAVRHVDPADLAPPDRVLAAALAVEVGDGRHAIALLDAAPLPQSLCTQEQALRAAATAGVAAGS